ncbi:hypothetical protein KQX54_002978 [Cotesia glomerata]|uniref:Lipocalin/cytosolic fatty-acid binding domain-containing protein n=1 Tax=Cotesia glomerata TaxID=32391 RepID=A0AAV7IFE4_COTGL|nr:hypothetical protein KQX54_002978 [Cotesia glomerata]
MIAGIFALETEVGPCPVITKNYLNLAGIIGRWYTYQQNSNFVDKLSVSQTIDVQPVDQNNAQLIFSDYSLLTKNKSTIVVQIQVDKNQLTNTLHIPGFGTTESIFYVLGTDYTRYGIIYGCEEYGNQHFHRVWIVTRERFPPASTNISQIVRRAFERNGLKFMQFTKIDQSCSYD